MRQVFIRRKKTIVPVDRYMGGLRESCVPMAILITFGGISSGFPLPSYLALPGFESVFGISHNHLLVHVLLSLYINCVL